jgi:hypothetical protein
LESISRKGTVESSRHGRDSIVVWEGEVAIENDKMRGYDGKMQIVIPLKNLTDRG